MNADEAYEWVIGKRSHWNLFVDSTPSRGQDLAACAVADAATAWQALAFMQAHKAGLIPNDVGVLANPANEDHQ